LIKLTGLNHKEFILNADHIEKLEEVPESLITLTNGKKYLVEDTVDEILSKIYIYKRKIFTFGFGEDKGK
jgi:flagellar protein FlbD